MKRLRLDRWAGQMLAGPRRVVSSAPSAALQSARISRRHQATAAAAAAPSAPTDTVSEPAFEYPDDGTDPVRFPPLEHIPAEAVTYPSPLPERALQSAKLAALHARLALSPKIPLQTLARALVDPSADSNPNFNNATLATAGHAILAYHTSELLMVRYPRLPMGVMYAAMAGYASDEALHAVAMSWGVESTTTPGGEVDAGLLQYSLDKTGEGKGAAPPPLGGYRRNEAAYLEKFKWRRGMSSRVVLDNDFGEAVHEDVHPDVAVEQEAQTTLEKAMAGLGLEGPAHTAYGNELTQRQARAAHANFVRATVGAIYAHAGRDAARAFVKAHVLSRQLELEKLFRFTSPLRELQLLCAREDMENPVARLLSETGRLSRTPVFVVGVYSGRDKLGEGAGASLEHARLKAAIHALKSWYLYSPGEHVRVPSDMLDEDAKPWEPPYVDIGEIISNR